MKNIRKSIGDNFNLNYSYHLKYNPYDYQIRCGCNIHNLVLQSVWMPVFNYRSALEIILHSSVLQVIEY